MLSGDLAADKVIRSDKRSPSVRILAGKVRVQRHNLDAGILRRLQRCLECLGIVQRDDDHICLLSDRIIDQINLTLNIRDRLCI